jgi:hypothetical protein
MPTRDGTLDDVVTLETEEHVPDAASFLGELRRILRIGWLEVLVALLADAGLTTLRYWDRLRRNAKGFRRAAFELYRRSWIVPSGWIVRACPVYLCVKARRGRPLAS